MLKENWIFSAEKKELARTIGCPLCRFALRFRAALVVTTVRFTVTENAPILSSFCASLNSEIHRRNHLGVNTPKGFRSENRRCTCPLAEHAEPRKT